MFTALALVAALSFQGQEQPARSGVVENTGNLAFGETLVVRRTEAGMEAVSATRGDAEVPVGMIGFSLSGSQETGSILHVQNNTDQAIAYVAYISRWSQGRAQAPARTNVCTVPAGLMAFEMWPEPVVQVVIGNVRTAATNGVVCEPQSVAD